MGDGCIVRMTDKQYLEKFINQADYETFTRVIISQRIRIDKDYPDTLRLPKLFPPPYCVSLVIKSDSCTDEYMESYLTYLNRPENLTIIAILISSILKTNGKLALICTEDENDYFHLEIICDLIEDIFEMKCYSLKKFLKLKKIDIPNKNTVASQLDKVLEYLEKIEDDKKYEEEIARRKVRRDLEDQEWDWLYSFCKKRGIKAKKKYDKTKLIDNIMKADKKSSVFDAPTDDDDDDEPRTYGKWPT